MKIVVIIVNFNTWDATRRMLLSASSLKTSPDFFVIDNKSSKAPPSDIKSCYNKGEVNFIQLDKNYGYFGAVGMFLENNPSLEFDWLFIANPDLVFIDSNLFENLVDLSCRNIDVGVYCPAIISSITGRNQNPFLVVKPSWLYYYKYKFIMSCFVVCKLYFYLFKLKRRLTNKKVSSAVTKENLRTIFAPHGAFLGLSKEYFHKGGVVETRNFLFYEEEIVGLICNHIGLKVYYDPRVQIAHEEHISTGDVMTRSKFLIKKKSFEIFKEYFIKTSGA